MLIGIAAGVCFPPLPKVSFACAGRARGETGCEHLPCSYMQNGKPITSSRNYNKSSAISARFSSRITKESHSMASSLPPGAPPGPPPFARPGAPALSGNLPHDRRGWMPAYAIPIQVITAMFLAVRVCSRLHRNGGRLGIDDVFVVLGWMTATAASGLVVWGTSILGQTFPY
jgi:hypothetical protein